MSTKKTKSKRNKGQQSSKKKAKENSNDFFAQVSLTSYQRSRLEFVADALSISAEEAYSICKQYNFDPNKILAEQGLKELHNEKAWSKKHTKHKPTKPKRAKSSTPKKVSPSPDPEPKSKAPATHPNKIPPLKHKPKTKPKPKPSKKTKNIPLKPPIINNKEHDVNGYFQNTYFNPQHRQRPRSHSPTTSQTDQPIKKNPEISSTQDANSGSASAPKLTPAKAKAKPKPTTNRAKNANHNHHPNYLQTQQPYPITSNSSRDRDRDRENLYRNRTPPSHRARGRGRGRGRARPRPNARTHHEHVLSQKPNTSQQHKRTNNPASPAIYFTPHKTILNSGGSTRSLSNHSSHSPASLSNDRNTRTERYPFNSMRTGSGSSTGSSTNAKPSSMNSFNNVDEQHRDRSKRIAAAGAAGHSNFSYDYATQASRPKPKSGVFANGDKYYSARYDKMNANAKSPVKKGGKKPPMLNGLQRAHAFGPSIGKLSSETRTEEELTRGSNRLMKDDAIISVYMPAGESPGHVTATALAPTLAKPKMFDPNLNLNLNSNVANSNREAVKTEVESPGKMPRVEELNLGRDKLDGSEYSDNLREDSANTMSQRSQPSPPTTTTSNAPSDVVGQVFAILANGGLVIVPPSSMPDIYKPFVLMPFDMLAKVANFQAKNEQISAEQLLQWYYRQQQSLSYAMCMGLNESLDSGSNAEKKEDAEQETQTQTDYFFQQQPPTPQLQQNDTSSTTSITNEFQNAVAVGAVGQGKVDSSVEQKKKEKPHPVLKPQNTGSIHHLRKTRTQTLQLQTPPSGLNPSATQFTPKANPAKKAKKKPLALLNNLNLSRLQLQLPLREMLRNYNLENVGSSVPHSVQQPVQPVQQPHSVSDSNLSLLNSTLQSRLLLGNNPSARANAAAAAAKVNAAVSNPIAIPQMSMLNRLPVHLQSIPIPPAPIRQLSTGSNNSANGNFEFNYSHSHSPHESPHQSLLYQQSATTNMM